MPRKKESGGGIFGTKVKELREAAGIKQSALAAKAGISKAHLSQLERKDSELGPIGKRIVHALEELDPIGPGPGVGSLLNSAVPPRPSPKKPLASPDPPPHSPLPNGPEARVSRGQEELADGLALFERSLSSLGAATVCSDDAAGFFSRHEALGIYQKLENGMRLTVVTHVPGNAPHAFAELVASCLKPLSYAGFELRVAPFPVTSLISVPGAGGAYLYPPDGGMLLVGEELAQGLHLCASEAAMRSRALVEYFAVEDERIERLFADTEDLPGPRHVLKSELSVVFMEPEVIRPYLFANMKPNKRKEALILIEQRVRRITRFRSDLEKDPAIDVLSAASVEALVADGTYEAASFNDITGKDYEASFDDRRRILTSLVETLRAFPKYQLAIVDDAAFGTARTLLFTKGEEGWIQVMHDDKKTIAYYLRTKDALLIQGLRAYIERLTATALYTREGAIEYLNGAIGRVPTDVDAPLK